MLKDFYGYTIHIVDTLRNHTTLATVFLFFHQHHSSVLCWKHIKQLKWYWESRKIIMFASYDDNIEVSYLELLLKWGNNNIGLWIIKVFMGISLFYSILFCFTWMICTYIYVDVLIIFFILWFFVLLRKEDVRLYLAVA